MALDCEDYLAETWDSFGSSQQWLCYHVRGRRALLCDDSLRMSFYRVCDDIVLAQIKDSIDDLKRKVRCQNLDSFINLLAILRPVLFPYQWNILRRRHRSKGFNAWA